MAMSDFLSIERRDGWDSVHDLVGGVGQAMNWSSWSQQQVTVTGVLYERYECLPGGRELGDETSNMETLLITRIQET